MSWQKSCELLNRLKKKNFKMAAKVHIVCLVEVLLFYLFLTILNIMAKPGIGPGLTFQGLTHHYWTHSNPNSSTKTELRTHSNPFKNPKLWTCSARTWPNPGLYIFFFRFISVYFREHHTNNNFIGLYSIVHSCRPECTPASYKLMLDKTNSSKPMFINKNQTTNQNEPSKNPKLQIQELGSTQH